MASMFVVDEWEERELTKGGNIEGSYTPTTCKTKTRNCSYARLVTSVPNNGSRCIPF